MRRSVVISPFSLCKLLYHQWMFNAMLPLPEGDPRLQPPRTSMGRHV